MTKLAIMLASALFGIGVSAFAQPVDTIAAGKHIEVRTNDTIDARTAGDGRIYTGVVNNDVVDNNGNVAIPKGSNAELIVRRVSNSDMAVDLESVSVNGRRYIIAANASESVRSSSRGIGKNKRTGEYVGGGALLGTLLGAIAGGGKGAAIGAIAGGAAGAGAQTITKGKSVHIPSESVLTFQLNQPLMVSQSADNGYSRDGYHYHNMNNNSDRRYRDDR